MWFRDMIIASCPMFDLGFIEDWKREEEGEVLPIEEVCYQGVRWELSRMIFRY